MNQRMKNQLIKELRDSGASPTEIRAFTALASELGSLRIRKLSKTVMPFVLALSAVAACIVLVYSSQNVLPTSHLYPVQKFADAFVARVDPSYRKTVMMKRADQVQELVSDKAQPKLILAALADYSNEADAYGTLSNAKYSAFRYCKSKLEQAALSAPSGVRQAIITSINSIDVT
jgi:hypothetical protein